MHTETDRWVAGDQYGLTMPAEPAALRHGGPQFLTEAFRVAGVLTADNAVTCFTDFREVAGGSTGRKVVMSVEYDKPVAGLHTDLFVKFSRDFESPTRDRGKTQMESEVRFASLARIPGFPVVVPSVLFGDYHRPTGTGILITERIQFGMNGIERQYHKCLDYEMPEPIEHYRALLTALGRLAGAHRSGRLPASVTAHFPLDVAATTVGQRIPLSLGKLDRQLRHLAELVDTRPGLFPVNVRASGFLARLCEDVPRIARHENTVTRQLAVDSDYVALCHWNANVDNAFFWRGRDDVLHCGLMDWGCVSEMNMGMAIWGAMSGAETDMWSEHLDELLKWFVAEVQHYGGAAIEPDRLRRHTLLYAAVMGTAWLLDVPALLRKRFGTAIPVTRRDPRIRDDESVRAPLQMLSNLLNLWERYQLGDLLDAAVSEAESVSYDSSSSCPSRKSFSGVPPVGVGAELAANLRSTF